MGIELISLWMFTDVMTMLSCSFFVFRGKAFAGTMPYQAHMMFHQAKFHRVNNTITFLHDMSRHARWQGLN